MSAMTDYLENKIADHIFRGQTFASPANLYLALFTSAPTDAGGGTEVSGGSYARVTIATGLTAFKGTHGTTTGASSGTSGQITLASAATFPAPTANWGTVTHVAVMDASSGGNMLAQLALSQQRTVNSGDPAPSFAADSLVFILA